MSNSEEGRLSSIISLVAIIAAIFGACIFNYCQGHSKAKTRGYECSWGPIQSCMLKQKDGSRIDYDRLRIMD